ncbi:MAG TPA: hypothetical protein PL151_08245 [Phycisphaerae bacterium]|nr:hypothetical protein [Phycisphaerae bacterium]HOJ75194.1 hypothetical protein [Phycisphaerae bacterium]HOM52455.1 hypothetical protein [Phycisphaerae bacterium]HON67011.1 hypothetical protein [Phycisphaerae bacterium]HOQ86561.1 hypothetical protein [Phycisphaerae bacterium]
MLLACLTLAASSGCDPTGELRWPFATDSPAPQTQPATDPTPAARTSIPSATPPAADAPRPNRPAIVVTTFTFDILRVRVPQGLFSESGKVWNHLESDFLPADTAKLLHRNGIRVGRANAESWPALRAILETEPRAETAQSKLTMSNGLPLLLELDRHPKDQILFLYRRDGTLAGAPWRSSTNVLRIEYGIPPTQPDAILVEVAPELRLDSPAAHTLRGIEHWDPTAIPERSRVIRDLAFRATLEAGQFLAIGPSSATRDLPYIMGALLLCEEQGGEKFESMYFITPTVSRTGD